MFRQYVLNLAHLFIFLTVSFKESKYFTWMKSNLLISFISCLKKQFSCVCVHYRRNSFLTEGHQREEGSKRFEHFAKDMDGR